VDSFAIDSKSVAIGVRTVHCVHSYQAISNSQIDWKGDSVTILDSEIPTIHSFLCMIDLIGDFALRYLLIIQLGLASLQDVLS